MFQYLQMNSIISDLFFRSYCKFFKFDVSSKLMNVNNKNIFSKNFSTVYILYVYNCTCTVHPKVNKMVWHFYKVCDNPLLCQDEQKKQYKSSVWCPFFMAHDSMKMSFIFYHITIKCWHSTYSYICQSNKRSNLIFKSISSSVTMHGWF